MQRLRQNPWCRSLASLRAPPIDRDLLVISSLPAPSFPQLPQETSGTTKLSAERTLARVLGLASGDELLTQAFLEDGAGTAARRQLTEAYVRRLTRLPPGDEDDDVEF